MTVAVQRGSSDDAINAATPTKPDRLVAGRFRLIEQLGRGGMGRVYRALDEVLNRPVAVKLIYDDAVGDRDLRHACALEARAAARLNHPGIVRILDSGFDDGHLYVVMSLAEGRTLAEILREDGPLSVGKAIDLAAQVADALAAAHREGVIHCDVKPGNLLVDAEGHVRLVDFGIARVTSSTTGLTGESLQGSAQYVAPEQVEGASVDGRTDLYALGTVLYEMLAGRTPFGGGTIAAILARRLVTDPPALRELNPMVPPQVEQVVLRALARDPEQRYQTVAEFRDALNAVRHSVPLFPLADHARAQTHRIPRWDGVRLPTPTLPRFDWAGSRAWLLEAGTHLTGWAADTGRRARAVSETAVPGVMARAQLISPTRRPTLRAGIAIAILIGLMVGAAAARCGVASVAAESAVALEPVTEVIATTVSDLPVPEAETARPASHAEPTEPTTMAEPPGTAALEPATGPEPAQASVEPPAQVSQPIPPPVLAPQPPAASSKPEQRQAQPPAAPPPDPPKQADPPKQQEASKQEDKKTEPPKSKVTAGEKSKPAPQQKRKQREDDD